MSTLYMIVRKRSEKEFMPFMSKNYCEESFRDIDDAVGACIDDESLAYDVVCIVELDDELETCVYIDREKIQDMIDEVLEEQNETQAMIRELNRIWADR